MPNPAFTIQTIERLCRAYTFLGDLLAHGASRVSSADLGSALGTAAHNVRKDISRLGSGDLGNSGAGYDVHLLRRAIGTTFNLGAAVNACIVGLGGLGTALLNYEHLMSRGCRLVAAFDADINRLETIRTAVPVFPSYEIDAVVNRLSIEIAFLTVPAKAAQEVTDQLVAGGIRGIVNFTPSTVRPSRDEVIVRNVDIMGEFAVLCSLIHSHPEDKAAI